MSRACYVHGVFVTALALSALALNANAKPVKFLSFSFALPDSWRVEADERDSGGMVFAAVPNAAPYEPPMLIALGCVNKHAPCSFLFSPEQREKELSEECPDAIRQSITHASNMVETRWICLPEALKGKKSKLLKAQRVASGVSWFDTTDGVLVIAYLAGPGDVPVEVFMADLSRTVRYNSSKQSEGK